MKVNIQLISDLSGYSIATVSNALNNKKKVNPETAYRILKIANEIGYVVKNKQKRIKLVTFISVGTVVEDTPFFSQLFEGITSESRANGYDVEIHHLDKNSSDYNTYLHQILFEPSEGILFLATEMSYEDAKPLSETKTPIVILDNWLDRPDFSTVSINNSNGAYEAVNFLIDNGHHRIGYLKGQFRINNFCDRENGYAEALADRGLKRNPQNEITLTSTMEGSYLDMLEYLEDAQQMPTAFFADNDIIAFGAIKALQEKGYTLPDDISIIGFDDMPYCEIVNPALSTIRVHKGGMGQLAVRRLIERINGETNVSTHTLVNTQLVIRDSVKTILK